MILAGDVDKTACVQLDGCRVQFAGGGLHVSASADYFLTSLGTKFKTQFQSSVLLL